MKLKIAKIVFVLCVNTFLIEMLYTSATKDGLLSRNDMLSIAFILLLLNSLGWSIVTMLDCWSKE